MATIASEPEEDSMESCILVRENVVSNKTTPRMKMTKQTRVQPLPSGKRPRGRPRKPKNNTPDTAIILSDSEPENDDSATVHPLHERQKRPLSRLGSPTPGPLSKRPSHFHAGSGSPAADLPLSVQAEVDRLKQQLSSEEKLRKDAEAERQKIERLMEDREVSWGAELAAHMAPLQLQIQRLLKEKQDAEVACRDLESRLKMAPEENREQQAPLHGLAAEGPDRQDLEAQIHEQAALIATQANTIKELRSLESSRDEELAKAKHSITTLTETITHLEARHDAATKMIQQHEARIEHLTHELSEAKDSVSNADQARAAADMARVAAEKARASADDRAIQAERQRGKIEAAFDGLQHRLGISNEARLQAEERLKTAEGKLTQTEAKLAKVEAELASLEPTSPAKAPAWIVKLRKERAAMEEELRAQLRAVAELRRENQSVKAALAAVENDKQQAIAACEEKKELQAELRETRMWAAKLQRENRQLQSTSTSTTAQMAALQKQLAEYKNTMETLAAENQVLTQERASALCNRTREEMQQKYRHVIGELTAREAQLKGQVAKLTSDLAARDRELRHLRASPGVGNVGKINAEEDTTQQGGEPRHLEAEANKHAVGAAAEGEQQQSSQCTDALEMEVSKHEADLDGWKRELKQSMAELAQAQKSLNDQGAELCKLQHRTPTVAADVSKWKAAVVLIADQLGQYEELLANLAASHDQLVHELGPRHKQVRAQRDQLAALSIAHTAAGMKPSTDADTGNDSNRLTPTTTIETAHISVSQSGPSDPHIAALYQRVSQLVAGHVALLKYSGIHWRDICQVRELWSQVRSDAEFLLDGQAARNQRNTGNDTERDMDMAKAMKKDVHMDLDKDKTQTTDKTKEMDLEMDSNMDVEMDTNTNTNMNTIMDTDNDGDRSTSTDNATDKSQDQHPPQGKDDDKDDGKESECRENTEEREPGNVIRRPEGPADRARLGFMGNLHRWLAAGAGSPGQGGSNGAVGGSCWNGNGNGSANGPRSAAGSGPQRGGLGSGKGCGHGDGNGSASGHTDG